MQRKKKQHCGGSRFFTPLLAPDVWEHTFMRDYAATWPGWYIDAFFRNEGRAMIEKRLREPPAVRPAGVV